MGLDASIWVTTPAAVTDDQLEGWSARLREAFGDDAPEADGCPCLERKDWDDASANGVRVPDGHTILHVGTAMRYYGPQYERGPWAILSGVCRWLSLAVPDATVWYGHDTGGERVWTPELDAALWEHFARHGTAYYGSHAEEDVGGG
jgi:hypothetical protein